MGYGFKHGGTILPTDAMELNFRILSGTAKPSTAQKNDIWVNTSTDISCWCFSVTEPSPVDGMVWIVIGSESEVAFNVLQDNTVMVYPTAVKQYVEGAWADRFAYCYTNNWVEFSSDNAAFILYDNGTANVEFTLNNATLEDSYIQLSIKNGVSFAKSPLVALDGYTVCEVDYHDFTCGGTTVPVLYIWVRNEDNETVVSNQVSKSAGASGTLSVEIDLTGSYFIDVRLTNTSTTYTASAKLSGIRLSA